MRVLLIEDDAALAETIAVFLRRRQLAVDVALDGRSGLDRAQFTDCDVVVLDRDLPEVHLLTVTNGQTLGGQTAGCPSPYPP